MQILIILYSVPLLWNPLYMSSKMLFVQNELHFITFCAERVFIKDIAQSALRSVMHLSSFAYVILSIKDIVIKNTELSENSTTLH